MLRRRWAYLRGEGLSRGEIRYFVLYWFQVYSWFAMSSSKIRINDIFYKILHNVNNLTFKSFRYQHIQELRLFKNLENLKSTGSNNFYLIPMIAGAFANDLSNHMNPRLTLCEKISVSQLRKSQSGNWRVLNFSMI